MKVAFMSFSWPQASLAQLLSAARTYGYDGLEPRTGHAHGIDLSASASERVEIRRQAQDSGVALCCLALSCRYTDPADVEQQVDETRRYVDLAADLEIPRLRVFGAFKLAPPFHRISLWKRQCLDVRPNTAERFIRS